VLVLFPADHFNIKCVDPDFTAEYDAVCQIPNFKPVLFNYDDFISGEPIKIYPSDYYRSEFAIYRGWMMMPDHYHTFYDYLLNEDIGLINSPLEYNDCHLFPNVYLEIEQNTPKILSYPCGNDIDWTHVNNAFSKFMVKDYVKSEKGTGFPAFFTTPVNSSDMEKSIADFIKMRGNLYTGGIVLKEYVELKKYGASTNEYRGFYLQHKILSISRNSNQPESCKVIPLDFVEKYSNLPSNYYTVDFAELHDGSWSIIEVGDGQVSGLSPDQWAFKYYDDMRNILLEIRNQKDWYDVSDILFSGTAEQIDAVKCPECGGMLRFSYCDSTRSTEISCSCTLERGYRAHKVPNFHIFGRSSSRA